MSDVIRRHKHNDKRFPTESNGPARCERAGPLAITNEKLSGWLKSGSELLSHRKGALPALDGDPF
jgi:hypothetical protein